MGSSWYTVARPFAGILKHFPRQLLGFRFKRSQGRPMQDPPVSFYDKVFWMSCCTDTTQWSELADKYRVRDYVERTWGKEILPELYGVYSSSAEIDFDELPSSFVLKTNNGCASNILVKDKESTDLGRACAELDDWLAFPYGELTGQPHYSRIEPKIIAEEFLIQSDAPDDPIADYKFFCFDGTPLYCMVCSDRAVDENGKHTYSRAMYDENWEPVAAFKDGAEIKDVAQPACFEEMKHIAYALAKGFPFVRVDLYVIDDHPKFGEMTFTPGLTMELNEDFQLLLGSLITLPEKSSR